MKLSTSITVPAIDELRAKQLSFPDGGDVRFMVAFYANGSELNTTRLEVVGRDAAPSQAVVVNASRTVTADAFQVRPMADVVTMAAGQLKLATRSGTDDDSSLEALLAKAVELGLVVIM